MIQKEITNNLVRHYSDANKMIKKVGTDETYEETWDINPCPYTYEETDQIIERSEEGMSTLTLDKLDKINTNINNILNENN